MCTDDSHLLSAQVTTIKRFIIVQWNLDLRKPDLRKNLVLRKIVPTMDFLAHKLFDLRKIFSQKPEKIGTFWQF